jgi:hypothetical protein
VAKFWELFKKFEESAPEEVKEEARVVGLGLTTVDRAKLGEAGLRLGMWVSTQEGIGIVTGIVANCATVMLVDDAGCNKRSQNFTLGSVQQAKLLQIPKARRPETAHSGY